MIPGTTNATKNFQIPMRAVTARWLSVLVLVSLPVGYLGEAVLPALGDGALGFLILLRLVGLVGAILLFLSGYGQLSQRAERDLDEREAQIRNRAYVLTHQVMVVGLFLAFFWVEISTKLGWWLPPAKEVGNLITAFALSSMALPAAILAWRDRASADEEGEEA